MSAIQEPLVVSGGGMSADKNGPTAATKNGLQHREADVNDVHRCRRKPVLRNYLCTDA